MKISYCDVDGDRDKIKKAFLLRVKEAENDLITSEKNMKAKFIKLEKELKKKYSELNIKQSKIEDDEAAFKQRQFELDMFLHGKNKLSKHGSQSTLVNQNTLRKKK